jgi:glutamate racemase
MTRPDPGNSPRILVFDSGVGGLSVLAEIHSRIPRARLIYACDNEAFPYGTMGEEALVTRVDTVLRALISRLDPDILVVACNTASTLALPRIRAHFAKPVVGVVPAIKPAAALSRTRVIGLLATPGTVNRAYTRQLIDDFAGDCTVVRVGSSELVDMAEAKVRGVAPDPDRLRAIVAPLFDNPATDTLVLACTHFPLLRQELETVAPRSVHWVDSGEAIARRVESLLSANVQLASRTGQTGPRFAGWLTSDNQDIAALVAGLENAGMMDLQVIAV